MSSEHTRAVQILVTYTYCSYLQIFSTLKQTCIRPSITGNPLSVVRKNNGNSCTFSAGKSIGISKTIFAYSHRENSIPPEYPSIIIPPYYRVCNTYIIIHVIFYFYFFPLEYISRFLSLAVDSFTSGRFNTAAEFAASHCSDCANISV